MIYTNWQNKTKKIAKEIFKYDKDDLKIHLRYVKPKPNIQEFDNTMLPLKYYSDWENDIHYLGRQFTYDGIFDDLRIIKLLFLSNFLNFSKSSFVFFDFDKGSYSDFYKNFETLDDLLNYKYIDHLHACVTSANWGNIRNGKTNLQELIDNYYNKLKKIEKEKLVGFKTCKLEYNRNSGELWINKDKIKKFQLDSNPEKIINYIFDKASSSSGETKITKNELMKIVKINYPLTKILDRVHSKNPEILTPFFRLTKDMIIFTPTVKQR